MQNWYCASKTQAESEAFEFAKRTGISLVSICPTMVFGPVLQQHTVNASTLALAKLLKGNNHNLGLLQSNLVHGLVNLDPTFVWCRGF